MTVLDWEQLESLKRQLEEDFRMDMAAIERLQRRFRAANEKISSAPAPAAPAKVSVIDTLGSPAPKAEAPPAPESDELDNTLRTMFSNFRK